MSSMTTMIDERTGIRLEQLTIQQIEAFTKGDCWAFALEVYRRYGHPVAVYASWDGEDDDSSLASQLGWVHAFNVLEDGRYFDVLGTHSEAEIIDQWELFFTVTELSGWTGIYIATDLQDTLDLIDFQDRLYPEVDVDAAVDAAYAALSNLPL
jgi:hypothetical protein